MYEFKKDISLDNVLNIKSGNKIIGFVSGFKDYSIEYSSILKSKSSSIDYIQIFSKYQRKGHCCNVIRQIINNNDSDYFVFLKPINPEVWLNISEKIKQEKLIKDYYFKKLVQRKDYEIKEDLILKK